MHSLAAGECVAVSVALGAHIAHADFSRIIGVVDQVALGVGPTAFAVAALDGGCAPCRFVCHLQSPVVYPPGAA
jgi:hypothetical protein